MDHHWRERREGEEEGGIEKGSERVKVREGSGKGGEGIKRKRKVHVGRAGVMRGIKKGREGERYHEPSPEQTLIE